MKRTMEIRKAVFAAVAFIFLFAASAHATIEWKNNATSAIANVGGITALSSSFTVTTGQGDRFPAVASPHYFLVTLVDTSGNREIVKVTARTADTMSITRAQEGTTARAFALGSLVEQRVTKTALDYLSKAADISENFYVADASAVDQSATTNTRSVQSLINTIGSKRGTIVLAHTGTGTSTTYTSVGAITIPANIDLVVQPGATIAATAAWSGWKNDVDAIWFGTSLTSTTINAALTAIGTTNKTTLLLRPSTWVMSANITVPPNVTLKMPVGASITPATFTLAINGILETGKQKIFNGTGTISGLKDAIPEWFGAVGDNATDDAIPLQQWANAVVAGNTVGYLDKKFYRTTATISFAGDTHIYGSGYMDSGISAIGVSAISFTAAANRRVQLHNLGIFRTVRYTPAVPNTDTGITIAGALLTKPYNCTLRDIYVDGFGTGISFQWGWASRFDNVNIGYGKIGIDIVGISDNNTLTNSGISVSGAGSGGVYMHGGVSSEGWVISHTLIYGAEIGIHAITASNNYVHNNIIDSVTASGIRISDDGTAGSYSWNISDNYIAVAGTAGYAAINDTNTIASAIWNRGHKIIGNHIIAYTDGGCENGIYLAAGSKGNIIEDNLIDYMGNAGAPAGADIFTNATDMADIISKNRCRSTKTSKSIYQAAGNNGSIVRDNIVANSNYLGSIDADVALAVTGESKLAVSAAANLNFTLADGTEQGQRKLIWLAAVAGGKTATVTIANHMTTSPESCVFSVARQYLILEWVGDKWATISSSCTF